MHGGWAAVSGAYRENFFRRGEAARNPAGTHASARAPKPPSPCPHFAPVKTTPFPAFVLANAPQCHTIQAAASADIHDAFPLALPAIERHRLRPGFRVQAHQLPAPAHRARNKQPIRRALANYDRLSVHEIAPFSPRGLPVRAHARSLPRRLNGISAPALAQAAAALFSILIPKDISNYKQVIGALPPPFPAWSGGLSTPYSVLSPWESGT